MNLSICLARLCKHLCAPNIYHQQVIKEKLCWYNRNIFLFSHPAGLTGSVVPGCSLGVVFLLSYCNSMICFLKVSHKF